MKPRIIVLGGCGFIGRNLIEFLICNDLADHVRVIDKVPPQIAWLNKKQQSVFDDERVTFKSANLINPDSCKNAFSTGDDDIVFDYVINCAGETKPGQTDMVYKDGIYKLSVLCAHEAAQLGVKRYVELSTGNMYSSDKMAITEDCKKEPWTLIAKWKLQVEENLQHVPNLNFTVIRPAIVYGIGDKLGLTPRLVIGSIYKYLGESMKLLWGTDLKMNTVHVTDVCRAIYYLMLREDTNKQIYNITDNTDTTQGFISCLISELFNINHDYVGKAVSTLAKANMESVIEDVNDKHMAPWAEICSRENITNTPLSPYVDKQLLTNKSLYMSNVKLLQTGFILEKPRVTVELLREVLEDFSKMNLFPVSLIS